VGCAAGWGAPHGTPTPRLVRGQPAVYDYGDPPPCLSAELARGRWRGGAGVSSADMCQYISLSMSLCKGGGIHGGCRYPPAHQLPIPLQPHQNASVLSPDERLVGGSPRTLMVLSCSQTEGGGQQLSRSSPGPGPECWGAHLPAPVRAACAPATPCPTRRPRTPAVRRAGVASPEHTPPPSSKRAAPLSSLIQVSGMAMAPGGSQSPHAALPHGAACNVQAGCVPRPHRPRAAHQRGHALTSPIVQGRRTSVGMPRRPPSSRAAHRVGMPRRPRRWSARAG